MHPARSPSTIPAKRSAKPEMTSLRAGSLSSSAVYLAIPNALSSWTQFLRPPELARKCVTSASRSSGASSRSTLAGVRGFPLKLKNVPSCSA